MHGYRAPRWLAGAGPLAGNVQTIWPALYSRAHPDAHIGPVAYLRERWDTPDEAPVAAGRKSTSMKSPSGVSQRSRR